MTAEQGYQFYPSRYHPPVGHAQLDVYLAAAPMGRIFDAASLGVRILDQIDAVPRTLVVVHHDESSGRRYRVALGRFWLHDFSGHALEGFSFGGNLTITSLDGQTTCRFESAAPVFELDPDSYDVERVFVDAVEALAGVLRAEWQDGSDAEWLTNLATVESFPLFVSSLATVQARLSDLAPDASYDLDTARLRSWISRVIQTLHRAGEWPEHVPTLGEMEQAAASARALAKSPGGL